MSRIVNLASLEELRELTSAEQKEEAVSLSDSEAFNKILCSLQARCVKTEYCVSDIRKKALKASGGDRQTAEALVEALVRDRFVDDCRYASAFAREKSSITGWGPSKIRYALTMKGIPRSVIDEAMPQIDAQAADTKMRKVLAAKWKTLREDPYGKFKLVKYGLSRGYAYDAVSDCVESLLKDDSCGQ